MEASPNTVFDKILEDIKKYKDENPDPNLTAEEKGKIDNIIKELQKILGDSLTQAQIQASIENWDSENLPTSQKQRLNILFTRIDPRILNEEFLRTYAKGQKLSFVGITLLYCKSEAEQLYIYISRNDAETYSSTLSEYVGDKTWGGPKRSKLNWHIRETLKEEFEPRFSYLGLLSPNIWEEGNFIKAAREIAEQYKPGEGAGQEWICINERQERFSDYSEAKNQLTELINNQLGMKQEEWRVQYYHMLAQEKIASLKRNEAESFPGLLKKRIEEMWKQDELGQLEGDNRSKDFESFAREVMEEMKSPSHTQKKEILNFFEHEFKKELGIPTEEIDWSATTKGCLEFLKLQPKNVLTQTLTEHLESNEFFEKCKIPLSDEINGAAVGQLNAKLAFSLVRYLKSEDKKNSFYKYAQTVLSVQ